jgi:hypothetical protein
MEVATIAPPQRSRLAPLNHSTKWAFEARKMAVVEKMRLCREAWRMEDEKILLPEDRRDGIAMVTSIYMALHLPHQEIYPLKMIMSGLELHCRYNTQEARARFLAWVAEDKLENTGHLQICAEADDRRVRIHQAIRAGCYPTVISLAKQFAKRIAVPTGDIRFMRYKLKLPIVRNRAKGGLEYSSYVPEWINVRHDHVGYLLIHCPLK